MAESFRNMARKIALPLEMDPDFGRKCKYEIPEINGFIVNAYGPSLRYEFVLLTPAFDCDDIMQNLMLGVLEMFLQPSEKYYIRDLDDEDVDFFLDSPIPVLNFHPLSVFDDKISFFWQVPPKHLMS